MIPAPYYTLINTSKGSDPAVVVVNSALRTFENRHTFPWHLRLTIGCRLLGANGMPTDQEVEVLTQLEAEISACLEFGGNALFLARITCRGTRELLYRVHDPKAANEELQQLVSAPSQTREWEYHMEHDLDWQLAQPELQIIGHDPRFN